MEPTEPVAALAAAAQTDPQETPDVPGAAGTGSDEPLNDPPGSASHDQEPPQPAGPWREAMLDRMFADVLSSLAEIPDADDSVDPGDAGEPRPGPVYGFPDLAQAFEQIKSHLSSSAPHEDIIDGITAAGERATARGQDAPAGPAVSPLAVPAPNETPYPLPVAVEEALAEPLKAARAALGDRADAPEWRRIAAVVDAFRHLGNTLKTAAGSYAREVYGDTRVQGFRRVIAIRGARVIASAAYGLAGRLERGAARAIRALRDLARKARDYADRLSGALPPGRTLQAMNDLRAGWNDLDQRLATRERTAHASTAGATAWPAALVRASVERMHQAYTTAAAAISDRVAASPAWQRITALWNTAAAAVSKVHQGVLRFEDDAATLGFMSAVWARTVETVSWGARQAMEHLAANGAHGSPGWHALRLLRHTAEETLAHLHGRLPRDQHAPLGTYDPPREAAAADLAASRKTASTAVATETEAAQGQARQPAARDNGALVAELIPVLDAIDQARQHGELTGGFAQVGKLTEQTAARLGLTRFGVRGEDFDPVRHDAVAFNDNGTEKPAEHLVAAEILRPGYTADGRVIRPASVVVAEATDGPSDEAAFISAASNQLTYNSNHQRQPAAPDVPNTASGPHMGGPPRVTAPAKGSGTER